LELADDFGFAIGRKRHDDEQVGLVVRLLPRVSRILRVSAENPSRLECCQGVESQWRARDRAGHLPQWRTACGLLATAKRCDKGELGSLRIARGEGRIHRTR